MKLYFESTSDRIKKAVYDARKKAVGQEMMLGRFGRKLVEFAEQFLDDYDIDADVKYLGYSYDRVNRYVKNGDELRFYKCKAEVPRQEIIDKLFDGKELWERDCKVKEDPRYNIFDHRGGPSHSDFYRVLNNDEYMFVEVSTLAKDGMLALYFELWVRMDIDKAEFERDNEDKRYKRYYN